MPPRFGNFQPQRPRTPPAESAAARKLAGGFALHQRGDLAGALAAYEAVLLAEPRNAKALALRGVIAIQHRDASAAVEWLTRSLAVDPRQPETLSNRGTAWLSLGRWSEALADFDAALRLKPDYPEAHSNRASALLQLGDAPAAIESCARALKAQPGFWDALRVQARAHLRLGQSEATLAIYDRLLAAHPEDAELLACRGDVLCKLGRHAEAVGAYDLALALRPADAPVWSNRGVALRDLKNLAAAIASFDHAIALQPAYAEAWGNRGVALRELKQPAESLASLERALALRPDFADAYYNAGIALLELGRAAEAEARFDQALRRKPANHEAHYNRGIALMEQMNIPGALAGFDAALALVPDFAPAHWNKAILHLLTGDFDAGWPLYEWRWKNEKLGLKPRAFPVPRWDGSQSLEGRVILLHAEQGLGDTIQFSRYAALVAARGATVILEVPRPLVGVLQGIAGVSQLVVRGESLPAFDYHAPLLSLPLAFRTDAGSIPSSPRYLAATPAKRAQWEQVMGPKTRPRAGLVWSGSTHHQGDRYRSITLAQLVPHLPAGWDFVSLQKEVRPADARVLEQHPEIRALGARLEDFTDTAAVIELLDVVISVDTSVAHLSGALGQCTWTLLPSNPDWRWLLGREDTPWYPTMKLYRQSAPGDWSGPLERIREDLRGLANEPRP
jgi:tetratricopeptide (TPR) repeat protein